MNGYLKIHCCWGAAVCAAFFTGSRDVTPNPEFKTGDVARGPDRQNNKGRMIRHGDHRRVTRASGNLSAIFGPLLSAEGDLDRLAEQAVRAPNPITRRLAFASLLEALTPENANAIQSRMVALGADGEQWQDFNYTWGAIAGNAAIGHAVTSGEGGLAAAITGWAAAKPDEALAYLHDLPEEMQELRDELTASVVSGISHHDKGMATDLVLQLAAEGSARAGDLMEIVAGETVRAEGTEAAARWSESLPDSPLKGIAMGRIAAAYAKKDPEAAANWVQRFCEEDYSAPMIEQIGGNWARTDPVSAVEWLESIPEGTGQTTGLHRAFGDWEDHDPAAAGDYLLTMPHSIQRDAAISGFAVGYAWQDPQIAIAWAQDIRDPDIRQTSLTRVGEAFFRKDPAAAGKWLESSGLPADSLHQIKNPESHR